MGSAVVTQRGGSRFESRSVQSLHVLPVSVWILSGFYYATYLTVTICLKWEMGRLFQRLRSPQILSRSGVKFRWASSESSEEIFIPRYLMLPMLKE